MKRVNKRKRADITAEQFDAFRKETHRLRKANGLSLAALADLTECTPGHLSQIERGAKYPSNELAEAIAEVFSLTVPKMCGVDDVPTIDKKIALNFSKAYLEKRLARGFKINEVAGFAGITRECYMDFEGGKCSLGDSVLEKLDRLYTVEKEVQTIEIVKEVTKECPVSLELIDKLLGYITDINASKDEQRDMFCKLSEARTRILERQLFG